MSSQSRSPKQRDSAPPKKSVSHIAEATPTVEPKAAAAVCDDSGADLWGSCIVFVLVQYMYYITLYPFVSGGDSGELMQAICSGDVMHPPGYPLFAILGTLVMKLPLPPSCRQLSNTSTAFRSPAYKINLMASFFGALCAVALYRTALLLSSVDKTVIPAIVNIMRRLLPGTSPIGSEEDNDKNFNEWLVLSRWSVRAPISAVVALFYSLSNQVWLYSIQSEVFSLNNMLCAWTMYITVRCVSSKDVAPLRLGAFFVGLCSCNQHTSIFMFTPAVVWIYINRMKDVHANILPMILCGIAGLLPYLYIPYQSRYLAVLDNWGEHRTLQGFIHHFLRKDYGTFQLGSSEHSHDPNIAWKYFGKRVSLYVEYTLRDTAFIAVLAWLMFALYIGGSFIVRKTKHVKKSTRPNFPSFFCISWLIYIIVFNYLANLHFQPLFVGIQARFYMQPNLLVVISSALMLFQIFKCLPLSHSLVRVTVPLMFVLSAWQVSRTLPTVNHSNDSEVYNFGKQLLDSMPPHSLLTTLGDLQHNSVKYLQSCENYRRDIVAVGLPVLSYAWYPKHIKEFEARDASRRVALHLPNVSYPIYPASVYQPYSFYLPDSYRIDQFYSANWNRYPGGIYSSGGMADGDQSHANKYVFVSNGAVERVVQEKEWNVQHQDIVTWVQDCLSKLQNRTADILRIRGNPVLYSSDTWEYELSHVLDIYTDDFIHRSIVSLTQWQDIPQETKMKAFEMLVSFVSRQIERMGPHSIRSSTYGLSHDNLNLNYRSCQRAVLSANMNSLHLSPVLKPEEAPAARQMVDDLSSCISGAQASGHSEQTLPAYIDVHRKLVNMLQALEAGAQ